MLLFPLHHLQVAKGMIGFSIVRRMHRCAYIMCPGKPIMDFVAN